MELKLETVKVINPDNLNVIIGQAHFIKTVEDIYETLVNAVPGIKFGLAFSEASGKCLVRAQGTDQELKERAIENVLAIGSGHCFFIMLKDTYPINVLNQIKTVSEVCTIHCASANPLEVIVAVTDLGRGIMGVIDGFSPQGVEQDQDVVWRKELLRRIGYKL